MPESSSYWKSSQSADYVKVIIIMNVASIANTYN